MALHSGGASAALCIGETSHQRGSVRTALDSPARQYGRGHRGVASAAAAAQLLAERELEILRVALDDRIDDHADEQVDPDRWSPIVND